VAGLEAAPTVKTVLQNKRVLYVSQARATVTGAEQTPAQDGEQGAAPEITSVIIVFAGTDQDAELIKLAQNDGTQVGALTAILRSREDDVNEATTGVTISLLIERYGVPVPNIVLLQSE
jgi:Flp pilus assembly protein CpaB